MRKEKNTFESPDKLNRLVEGTKIVGDITTDSNIRVDGEIIGNLNCTGKVVIGETALIKGNLTCSEADVEGSIEGDLNVGALLVLRDKSKVSGNIFTSKIEVHQGAVFLGSCDMSGNSNNKSNHQNNGKQKKSGELVY
jgi:cytoskeletal protein CcmA (bactofilin family)